MSFANDVLTQDAHKKGRSTTNLGGISLGTLVCCNLYVARGITFLARWSLPQSKEKTLEVAYFQRRLTHTDAKTCSYIYYFIENRNLYKSVICDSLNVSRLCSFEYKHDIIGTRSM